MRRDGHTLKGKWAVVTGGSSGIGLCFSQELARRGCSVVMVSNEEKIAACAREVAENYGVRALGLLCDLTSAKAVDSVYFDGEIVEVRDATDEELHPKHACGCGCSHHGGCDEGCGCAGEDGKKDGCGCGDGCGCH